MTQQQIQPPRGMNDVCRRTSAAGIARKYRRASCSPRTAIRKCACRSSSTRALFKRSIGEFTDSSQKEMYTFEDPGGDQLTLRPEATAGIVRAMI